MDNLNFVSSLRLSKKIGKVGRIIRLVEQPAVKIAAVTYDLRVTFPLSSFISHNRGTHTLWLLLSAVSPSVRPSLSLLHPCSLSVNFTHIVKLPEVKMVVWVPQGWNDWQWCSWRTAELAASNTVFHAICWQLSQFCGCCNSTHPVLLLLLLVRWVLIWQYQLCSTDKYIENWYELWSETWLIEEFNLWQKIQFDIRQYPVWLKNVADQAYTQTNEQFYLKHAVFCIRHRRCCSQCQLRHLSLTSISRTDEPCAGECPFTSTHVCFSHYHFKVSFNSDSQMALRSLISQLRDEQFLKAEQS